MDKTGYIEIRITGAKGNLDLTPDNYDIREIVSILENAESLLFPGDKRDRPVISYQLAEGSVRHIFKTSIQYILGFNAVIGQISIDQNIDFLETATAKAFENIQHIAEARNYTFRINTSLKDTNEVRIDPATRFYRTEAVWADAEFYFYGSITNAGGKEKANIHVLTEEYGTLKIQTPKTMLEQLETNILYHKYGIRAIGKQHSQTGEIDTSSLTFVELIDYQAKYDEAYLNRLIDRSTPKWSDIKDKDSWLREIRGGYDA